MVQNEKQNTWEILIEGLNWKKKNKTSIKGIIIK
jgi:hypothetical protein